MHGWISLGSNHSLTFYICAFLFILLITQQTVDSRLRPRCVTHGEYILPVDIDENKITSESRLCDARPTTAAFLTRRRSSVLRGSAMTDEYVSLYVRLSSRITRKPHGGTSLPDLLCTLPVQAVAGFSFCDGVAIRRVFPVLWMTFHITAIWRAVRIPTWR